MVAVHAHMGAALMKAPWSVAYLAIPARRVGGAVEMAWRGVVLSPTGAPVGRPEAMATQAPRRGFEAAR
jgi:hypothetical protein